MIKREFKEEKMLTNETIDGLLGITESYQAPQVMMEYMLDNSRREDLFNSFIDVEWKMDYEWFSGYFESEHADRKVKKQDFTPQSVSGLLASLVSGNTYFECAAGTGGIMIQNWHRQRLSVSPSAYDPRSYWYQVEELSDRAIPFLIFNMAIRGMNGVIIHGDSLMQTAKEVYFIRNDSADFQRFSEVIKMPHRQDVERELNITFSGGGD